MKKVLMIGPARDVKGGMTTVVNNILDSSMTEYVEVDYLESINDKNKFLKLFKEVSGFIQYFLKVKKYEIIHIHMASRRSTFRKIKYLKIAKIKNKKVIVHLHGGGFENFYKNECTNKKQRHIRKLLNMADRIVVLSKESLEFLNKDIIEQRNKVTLINNGVLIPKSYNKEVNTEMIFLGRINDNKGIFEFLPILHKIKQVTSNFRFHICGIGNENKLIKLIKQYSLEENIVLHGWIDKETRSKLLRKCSIFILPSHYEAMPMSLLEAMAYGLIPFVTSVGSIPEIVTDNINGKLYRVGELDEMHNDLINIFYDKDKSILLSSNARKVIESRYNLENNMKELINIYREV